MDFFPAIIIISLIGGIVAVDTTAGWQVMINQPVVICPVLGVIFGQPELGVLLGILLELPWLINIPSGGIHGSEGNIGAVVATALSIYFISNQVNAENIIIICTILYSLFISRVGSYCVEIVRHYNLQLVHAADQAAEQGDLGKISRLNLIGIFYMFIMGVFLVGAGFSLGIIIVQPIVESIPPHLDKAMGLAKYALLGVGFGAVATLFINKKTKWYFLTAVVISFIILGVISL